MADNEDRRKVRRAPVRALKSIRYAPQLAQLGRGEPRPMAARAGGAAPVAQWLGDRGHPWDSLMKLYREIWWRDEYRIRSTPVPEGATVIDIGANVGMFALRVALAARPRRVLCYEPFPESFALLCRNAARNSEVPIMPFRLAVAGSSGSRTLYVDPSAACNGFFGGAGRPAITVDCVTLAELFERQRIDRCDLLKLDCEGAEFEILLNAPGPVLSRIGPMVLEYHEGLTSHLSGELVELLRGAGFSVRREASGQRGGYLFASRW